MSFRDRKFYAGVCVALQAVAHYDEGVVWTEIVKSVGPWDFRQYVTVLEPEERKLVKFDKYWPNTCRAIGIDPKGG
jgi:hypothetical protein